MSPVPPPSRASNWNWAKRCPLERYVWKQEKVPLKLRYYSSLQRMTYMLEGVTENDGKANNRNKAPSAIRPNPALQSTVALRIIPN